MTLKRLCQYPHLGGYGPGGVSRHSFFDWGEGTAFLRSAHDSEVTYPDKKSVTKSYEHRCPAQLPPLFSFSLLHWYTPSG